MCFDNWLFIFSKKNNLNLYLTPHAEINSKQIRDTNKQAKARLSERIKYIVYFHNLSLIKTFENNIKSESNKKIEKVCRKN